MLDVRYIRVTMLVRVSYCVPALKSTLQYLQYLSVNVPVTLSVSSKESCRSSRPRLPGESFGILWSVPKENECIALSASKQLQNI